MLADPLEAFAARMLLVRAAESTLDVQYYIGRPDLAGMLLLEAPRDAADRGVRVRPLLDDNGIAGLDPLLVALDAHTQAGVRLFNPYPRRSFKMLGYLIDFARVNCRMHTKALIADTQAAIVGGRNVGNAYVGADQGLELVDIDVLAAGPIAVDVASSFDDYWSSALSYPASTLLAPALASGDALTARAAEVAAMLATARSACAVRATDLAAQLASGTFALEWVPMQLVADPAAEAEGRAAPLDFMAADLSAALGRVEHELDLVSAYFVPGVNGTAMLARYPPGGVQLRVVTNSLAATDVAAVHAGYARRRVDLLLAGVRLYEIKPEGRPTGAQRIHLGSSGAASLHGKTFVVDRKRVFVGSFNIDPRSVSLNTEMGLVIDSPVLAGSLSSTLDLWLPAHAYELRLGGRWSARGVDRTHRGRRGGPRRRAGGFVLAAVARCRVVVAADRVAAVGAVGAGAIARVCAPSSIEIDS